MKRFIRINHSNQKPDPYKVGAVLGRKAFQVGDWVIIRSSVNKLARVKRLNDTSSVQVILGEESDPVHGYSSHYYSDLGYPLNSDFWSKYQKEQYRLLQSDACPKEHWHLAFDELYLPPILMEVIAVTVIVTLTTITGWLFLNIKTIDKTMDIFWTSFFTSISHKARF
jgi:hypothetical protein